ncbi:MAG: metallophosphoesterase [Bacteroidia bacterium]
MTPRIIAIGDIHGCSKTFKKLLLDELRIQQTDEIYCLGDYIDRGYDSKGVVDFILELREKKFHIHTLRGNHEQVMMDSTLNEENYRNWLALGGARTLNSFGVRYYHEFDLAYINFFKDTELFIETGNYIFVHAGLNFKNHDLFEDKDAMLWIRDFKVDKNKLGNRIVVHGHNPHPKDFILNQKIENAVNIDAGCVFNDRKGYGSLIALNLTERKFIAVKNCE